MNSLIWIAQVFLAIAFLFAGMTKLAAFSKLRYRLEKRAKGGPIRMTYGQAVVVGLLEIAGALGVLIPPALVANYEAVLYAAGGLALLMIAAGIYHLRRNESAAPAVTLFLLALFVIVGRWPH
jgi:uncharacterized membrane protein